MNEKEWCVDDLDDHIAPEEDYIYVNLLENKETFTAFNGAPIWTAIYTMRNDKIRLISLLRARTDEVNFYES